MKRSEGWLTLADAASLLGVHPATLRAWADQGRVPSQRTAGGHRRFIAADLRVWIDARRSNDAGAQALISSALGRLRLEIDRVDAPWLARLDEAARRAHRDLGRRLLQEVARAAAAPELSPALLAEAQSIGREYAVLSHRPGLALTDALRAFLFFRDVIVGALVQMSSAMEPVAAPGWSTVHRHLSAFLNEVLIALVATFEVQGHE